MCSFVHISLVRFCHKVGNLILVVNCTYPFVGGLDRPGFAVLCNHNAVLILCTVFAGAQGTFISPDKKVALRPEELRYAEKTQGILSR